MFNNPDVLPVAMAEQLVSFRKIVTKSLLREIPNENRGSFAEGDFVEVRISMISKATTP